MILLPVLNEQDDRIRKEFGARVELVSFCRLSLGEGIEKEETDFASEVAATLNN